MYDPLVSAHPGVGVPHSSSYWVDTAGSAPEDDGPVTEAMDVDVAIIGAGYAGLSCALHLAREHAFAPAALAAETARWIDRLGVRCAGPHQPIGQLSGGNQQKVALGRLLRNGADILLLDEPTRGVDIGAIEFIHRRIIQLRDEGKAVLLVSVELDEIRSLSDRILVMFAGRIMGERGPDADERDIGLLMAGVVREAA